MCFVQSRFIVKFFIVAKTTLISVFRPTVSFLNSAKIFLSKRRYSRAKKFHRMVCFSWFLQFLPRIPHCCITVDVLVSTPNRLAHHLQDMKLKFLRCAFLYVSISQGKLIASFHPYLLRWLIVDESDRLFEVVEGQERCFRNQVRRIYVVSLEFIPFSPQAELFFEPNLTF